MVNVIYIAQYFNSCTDNRVYSIYLDAKTDERNLHNFLSDTCIYNMYIMKIVCLFFTCKNSIIYSPSNL